MTSRDRDPAADGVQRAIGEDALLRDGWQRRFVAGEPRLSESVEMYEELGYEVTTVPVDVDGGGCTACVQRGQCEVRVIFTRQRERDG